MNAEHQQQHATFNFGGHACHIDFGGLPITLHAFGECHRFEWHNYCGPMFVSGKNNDSCDGPNEKSRWWDAFTLWDLQGKRTEKGVAVWTPGIKCLDCDGDGGHRINNKNVMACKSCSGIGGTYPTPLKKCDYAIPKVWSTQ